MAITEDAQITCRFTTKLPAEYRIPGTEIVSLQGYYNCDVVAVIAHKNRKDDVRLRTGTQVFLIYTRVKACSTALFATRVVS
jgi:hypothetical protein